MDPQFRRAPKSPLSNTCAQEVERQLQQPEHTQGVGPSSQPQPDTDALQSCSAPSTLRPANREPPSHPATAAAAATAAPATTSLTHQARNPRLVGRHAPPYATATTAAIQAARSTGAAAPQSVQTGTLLQLGGPGPLGSPLAKLMHK